MHKRECGNCHQLEKMQMLKRIHLRLYTVDNKE